MGPPGDGDLLPIPGEGDLGSGRRLTSGGPDSSKVESDVEEGDKYPQQGGSRAAGVRIFL